MTESEIFSLSLDIGQEIIRAGGEVHRAEDTIIRINRAYGRGCVVFALPTLIIAQSGSRTEIRRIEREETDLAELARLNAFSRKLCRNPYDEILITKNSGLSKGAEYPAVFIATFSFCIFFGGRFADAVLSGLIGMLLNAVSKSYRHRVLAMFSSNLIESFIAGALAHLPLLLGIYVMPDKIIIGTIMMLVPGLTVVSAIRDMMSGDLVAGIVELVNAVISALAIAFGIAGAIFIFNGNG